MICWNLANYSNSLLALIKFKLFLNREVVLSFHHRQNRIEDLGIVGPLAKAMEYYD